MTGDRRVERWMGRWMPLNLPFGQPPPHLAQASPARLARVCRASVRRSRNRAARAAPVHLDAPVDPPVGVLAEGVHDKVEHQGPALASAVSARQGNACSGSGRCSRQPPPEISRASTADCGGIWDIGCHYSAAILAQ